MTITYNKANNKITLKIKYTFLKGSLVFLQFFLLSIFFSSSSYASNWQKFGIVIPTSSYDPHDPTIVLKDNIYRIWLTKRVGSWRIGYGTSLNGKNWNISNSYIPSSSDGWEKEMANPTVIYNTLKAKYEMLYSSINTSHWVEGLDRFRLRYATSLTGSTWDKSTIWSSTINSDPWADSTSWDKGGIARGLSLLRIGGTYHLWYSGTNENHLGTNPFWRIGYATSVNGINWTKQNNGNPVIVPTTSWELNNVSYPNVLFEDGKYKMWYAAGLGDLPQQIVYAESGDGINWVKPTDKNPALTRTPGSFDSTYMASPFVMKDEGIYKMWYSGFNGSYWAIGYATKSANLNALNVPLLKQTSEPWKSEIYNRADKWNPKDPTINAWGCAMTSAAMVLKYYGINKLPNGLDIDPGTLNQWLKEQPDGYIGKGNLNWLAISRLSKLAKTINGITNFDALEFFRTKGENKTLLTEDINKSQPDILEEPGHFIVAKGIQDDTFLINDPAYNRLTLNDGYSNSFLSMRRFVPSSTDLSYIMLVVNLNINIKLKDSFGNIVGEEVIEDSLISYADPNDKNDPVKIIYLPKPSSGQYTISLSSGSETIFELESYLYDKDGNAKVIKEKVVGSKNNETFTVNFDQENSNNSSSEKIVTFESTINDINELKSLKLINGNLANTIINSTKLAQKFQKLNKPGTVRSILEKIEKILKLSNGKLIEEDAYNIILYDITYLKSHL